MKRARRFLNRTHRLKWAAFGGVLGSATVVLPLFQDSIPRVPFAILTVFAFALSGISHFLEPDDA